MALVRHSDEGGERKIRRAAARKRGLRMLFADGSICAKTWQQDARVGSAVYARMPILQDELARPVDGTDHARSDPDRGSRQLSCSHS